MESILASIFGALALACIAAPAQADVIYQSVEDLAAHPDATSLCTACNDRFRAYEGVRLDAGASITSIDLVVRAFAGACCFYDDHFYINVYDGRPDDQAAPLVYSHRVFAYNSGHGPQDQFTAPGVLTGFDSAIVNAPTPDLLLQKNHDYTFSFFDSDFHIAVFRSGLSPLYQDQGPVYGYGARDKFVYYLSNGTPNSNGAAGFRLNGTATAVPEPAAWGLMILGFGFVGAIGRRREGSAMPAANACWAVGRRRR